MSEFSDKTVLVTGGSRGIGRAAGLRLAREGARIAINYVSNKGMAEETLQDIKSAGGTGVLCPGDVADPKAAASIVATARDALGPIDMLVHSAGIVKFEQADEVTWDSWKHTLNVNLDGTFNMIYAVKD